MRRSRSAPRTRRWSSTVGALSIVVALTGCADNLSFRRDDSLTIVTPADRELVGTPLRVQWQVRPRPAAVRAFAVFVDRAPQPPGTTIEHFKEDNRVGIFVTKATSLAIPAFERRQGVAKALRDRHRVVVVPLDARGRRIGENVDTVEFDVFVETP